MNFIGYKFVTQLSQLKNAAETALKQTPQLLKNES